MRLTFTVDMKEVTDESSLFKVFYDLPGIVQAKTPPKLPLNPYLQQSRQDMLKKWLQLQFSLRNFKFPEFDDLPEEEKWIHLIILNWEDFEGDCFEMPVLDKWSNKIKMILADATNRESRRDDYKFTFELRDYDLFEQN